MGINKCTWHKLMEDLLCAGVGTRGTVPQAWSGGRGLVTQLPCAVPVGPAVLGAAPDPAPPCSCHPAPARPASQAPHMPVGDPKATRAGCWGPPVCLSSEADPSDPAGEFAPESGVSARCRN